MKHRILVVLVLVSGQVALADDPADTTPLPDVDPTAAVLASPPQPEELPKMPASTRVETVYRLKNAGVQDVARALDGELQTVLKVKPKHDGTIAQSPVVLVPETTTNSLLISAEQKYAEWIAKRIEELDLAPTMIVIQAMLTIIDEDGKPTVISRPQVMAVDGATALIEVGKRGGMTYRVEMTPHVVQPNQSSP